MKTLEEITLSKGAHEYPEKGMCVMEATAYIAGEPFSDHPECVCPVLAAFARAWNDGLPDNATRDRLLKPFIPRLINTKSTPEIEGRRGWMATDWFIRVHTVAWLRVAKLKQHADALAAPPEICDEQSWQVVRQIILTAKKASTAARAAARAAASAAVSAAVYDAAYDASSAAAYAAAHDASSAAVYAAVYDAASAAVYAAVYDAAYDASSAAVSAAVYDASSAAARAAAYDASSAAVSAAVSAAACDVLKTTLSELQISAVDLFDRMINVK